MAVNRNYKAREIACMSFEQLRTLPEGGLYVEYDDGTVVKSKTGKTIYASHYWKLILKYGGTITQDLSLCKMVDGDYVEDMYTKNTHLTLASKVFDVAFRSGPDEQDRFWEMSEDIYHCTNAVANYNTLYQLEYMSCLSAKDIYQMMNHPKIINNKKLFAEGKISIEDCHDRCYSIVHDDKDYFKMNNIHLSVRCGLLSIVQLKQIIGPRGNVPDINSEAFPNVIEAGFAERMCYGYDSVVEARSASVALYMQGGPLEDSEYNNRMCQLLCSVLRRVDYTDCGSKEGMLWHVKDKSHLASIVGRFAIFDKDGKTELYEIRDGDEFLIGSTILIRSPSACRIKDKGVKCHRCIGAASRCVTPDASPGHDLIIDPLGQISQTILSTKHVLSNIIPLTMRIVGEAANYIELHHECQYAIMLKRSLDISNLRIRVPHDQAAFLSDLEYVDDINKVNVTAITDISDMLMVECHANGTPKSYVPIETSVSKHGASFTKEMLRYVDSNGWDIVDGFIEVDMANWNINEPILVTKAVSKDVTETLDKFKKFINPPKDVKKRTSRSILEFNSPDQTYDDAVYELYSILSSKLRISAIQIEMFICALMKRTKDFNLPDHDEEFIFTTMNSALSNRSALISLGFESQLKYICDPDTYIKNEDSIPSFPMDALLMNGNIA